MLSIALLFQPPSWSRWQWGCLRSHSSLAYLVEDKTSSCVTSGT